MPGNRPKNIPRLRANPLRMREMACVVVRHLRVNRRPRRDRRPELRDKLRRVTDARAEIVRALGPRGVIDKELAVFLHRGPASRRVHGNAVDPRPFEHLDRFASEGPRLVQTSGMSR